MDRMVIRIARKVTIAFVVIATIDACVIWIFGPPTLIGYYNILVYSGAIVFILSIFALGNNRISGYRRKPFISSDSVFMKARAFERPFEETILSITLASIIVFAVGQLLAML
jgi:hypothetical protein